MDEIFEKKCSFKYSNLTRINGSDQMDSFLMAIIHPALVQWVH